MKRATEGFALIVALSLVAILAIVLATHSLITVNNARTSSSSAAGSAGFYAAEAALNARAERVRQQFKGFEVPAGTTPSTSRPCVNGDNGAGDFQCESATVAGRTVTSYVKQDPSVNIKIPAGETFENLTAEETPFTVVGQSLGRSGNPEALTTLAFRSRLVPLFQFAVFFDKDLEFTNTATLNLSGPVHTNGNLFLDSGASPTQLTIRGQTTASHDIFRGWKHQNVCQGNVQIEDAGKNLQGVNCNGSTRTPKPNADLTAFGGRVKADIGELEVPSISALQPSPGADYWRRADVRIVLKRMGGLLGTTWETHFVTADGQRINVASNCEAGGGTSALSISTTFRDNREAQFWSVQSAAADRARVNRRMLEVDVPRLLSCLQRSATNLSLSGGLANTTDGGLVIFLTVDDKAASTVKDGLLGSVLGNGNDGAIAQTSPPRPNNYGIRLRNGALLRSNDSSHPLPRGITFVTDQAAFIQGNFNSAATPATGWIPSSVLSDSVNVLSSNWASTTPCQLREGGNSFFMSTQRRLLVAGVPTVVAATVNPTTLTPQAWSGNPLVIPYEADAGGNQTWYRYTTAALGESATADQKSQRPLFCRYAAGTTPETAQTTINTAVLAGTATTGEELKLYDTLTTQSGGVHNMMRFHEEWGANNSHPSGTVNYNYRGSLVSLDQPQHAVGPFQIGLNLYYNPPQRNWGFEELFREAKNLPPLTPRFVYLKQDNFTRSFEQP